MTWLTEERRRWAYAVVIALLGVLASYGIIELDGVALWVTLAGAVLGIGSSGLAVTHVGAYGLDDPHEA